MEILAMIIVALVILLIITVTSYRKSKKQLQELTSSCDSLLERIDIKTKQVILLEKMGLIQTNIIDLKTSNYDILQSTSALKDMQISSLENMLKFYKDKAEPQI